MRGEARGQLGRPRHPGDHCKAFSTCRLQQAQWQQGKARPLPEAEVVLTAYTWPQERLPCHFIDAKRAKTAPGLRPCKSQRRKMKALKRKWLEEPLQSHSVRRKILNNSALNAGIRLVQPRTTNASVSCPYDKNSAPCRQQCPVYNVCACPCMVYAPAPRPCLQKTSTKASQLKVRKPFA